MALSARNPERGTHEPVRPSRRLDVYLVSGDDAFLIEAGPAFSDRFRTRPVDDVAALPDPAEDTHWIVVFDAIAQSDPRAAVAQLEQRIQGRPIIVVVPDGDSTDWRSALSRGIIIDVLPREALQQPRFAAALVTAEERVQSAALPIPEVHSRANTPRRTLVPIVVGTLAVAALLALWLHHRGGVTSNSAPHPVAAVPSSAAASGSASAATAKAASVTELLSAARVAFANPKTVLPRLDGDARGDSALELYSQILTQDPINDEALDGIQRIWAEGRTRIQADVGSGKLDEASQLLADFKAAAIDPREISDMEASIATARPRWLATRTQESIAAGDLAQAEQFLAQLVAAGTEPAAALDLRHAIDGRKSDAQLAALARDVKAALDAGALLEPASDNVSTRLQAMRQISRTSTLTLNAQRDVQAALLSSAQEATQKGQFELAQRLIGAAAELAPTVGTAEAKKSLQAEMEASAQRAATAAAAAASAKLAASSTAPPAPVTPAVDEFIAAKPVRPLDVAYPRMAEDANEPGYVVVEFTLQPNGQASGAHVIEANPPKTFDASALAAVAHGRFDTSHLVHAQPQRARIKVSYAPSAAAAPGSPATAAGSLKPAAAPAPPAGALIAAKPARPLNVVYPNSAESAKIQGYVIVEFTLQHDGRAADAHVVESSPSGVFDANALDAVSHGRFDTSNLANGQPQRAHIRLSFKSS
jgi:TonB family protein